MSAPADFRSLVVRRRDACVKFTEDKPRTNRREALDFYNGKNLDLYGDSGNGMSTVVSRDVMEAIEGIMPPLVRPFVAGEEVVAFEPVEEADEEAVAQATDYVNHVFRRHNNVLHVAQTGLKDGLLFRMGVAKTVVEEVEDGEPEVYDGLGDEDLIALRGMLAQEGRDTAGDTKQDRATGLYSVTVPPRMGKRYRVYIVAPDEFLYEERLASLTEATFLGHRRMITLADLIDMGIDEKAAKELDSKKPETDGEEEARFDDGGRQEEWKSDDMARPVWVDECYIRCDYEKNGVLVWRKVLVAGAGSTFLSDEAADDHPYSVWTPIPMPHKLVGLSMFDLTRDIQMQKTALVREQLNNLYLVNRPQREVLDGQVNIDDLLSPALNGVVRVKQMNSINQLTTPFVAAETFGMIEYLDSQREARTGVTRYNQGMDSNSLNKTATGMNIISSNSQQRQELVARQFGEFLKDIFQKVLDLAKRHAEPEEVARLTGKPFVDWPTDYDATVSVGLGTNNKDQLVGHLMGLAQMHEKIIGLQQGLNGPLVQAQDVYEVLKRLPEAMGLKGAFFTDPGDMQQQPQTQEPPQDPLAEARLKQDTELQKQEMKSVTDIEVARIKQPPPPPYAVAM